MDDESGQGQASSEYPDLTNLALSARLRRMQTSLSWRATKPLRDLGGLYHKYIRKSSRLDLLPIHELQLITRDNRVIWVAVGDDPQFLLTPLNPAVLKQGGWFSLEYEFSARFAVEQCVYLDYGDGFQPDVVWTRAIAKPGRQRLVVYIPRGTQGLRLDPMTRPGEFQLDDPVLRRIDPPQLERPWSGIDGFLKCCEGCTVTLTEAQQLERCLEGEFHWRSHGTDPAFTVSRRAQDGLSEGWCRIEFIITGEYQHQVAKLYIDYGEGFTEDESYPVPFQSGMSTSRVLRLSGDVVNIRFDPWEREGLFRLERLCIDNILEGDAHRDIASRLASSRPEYAGLSASDIWLGAVNDVSMEEDEHHGEPGKISQSEGKVKDLEGPEDILHRLLEDYAETFIVNEAELSYQKWIDEVETLDLPSRDTIKDFISAIPSPVVISILVPVYNTDEHLLAQCIESVIAQSYPHWELCLVDDASPSPHVSKVLKAYSERDKRIKYHLREDNGHISKTTNDALALATGEYVALLDHDDELAVDALYFVAREISEHPDAQIIYSDEDKIDFAGMRCEPHFKPDWNVDLLYSQNYVSHLGVYQRKLVEKIGGFRVGVEGSQDYDLVLRCLPHVHPDNIRHIPRVLYHWRAIEGSTALAEEGKDYTTSAGIQALQDHFMSSAVEGAMVQQGMVANTYRVQWPIPQPSPLVSMLIPTRDKKEVTELAVRSILEKTLYSHYEIIILDNGSVEPETHAFFEEIQREDSRVTVVRYDHPFNYSAINNFGATLAKGSVIGLINNDVEVISPEWLGEMVSHVCREDVGCVGAKLYYGNDTIQHAGVIVGLGGVAGHSHKHFPKESGGYFNRLKVVQSVTAVTAACLLVRRDVYNEVRGLNENELKVAFNDVDFCLKVHAAGYRNIWTPYAELYHHESISRGAEDNPEKVARFNAEIEYMKNSWGRIIDHDPSYNPCLTKSREDFSIGGR
ncbi:glycosyltransferase family 2 protein [Halomonas denitrificans]|uniref:glycosyltransferase family 2 protein n=1 Tax=Halomonas denitrificans TaxID=370769 RepID=UPI001CD53AB5|nr:glycosyltransferase family 2 protein [Halomonas denitrificans]MCA0974354.1 glycosyltransferase family 2 protein [Halomonas denitrificans]